MSVSMTKRNGVRIVIVETGEEFNSIKSCSDYLHVNPSWLSKIVRESNKLYTCHGYHIMRIDDPRINQSLQRTERRGRQGTRIRIVETGETFNSISDCAKAINGSAGTIHDSLYNNRNRTTYRGLHFELD